MRIPRGRPLPQGTIQTADVGTKLLRRYGLHGKSNVPSIADQLFPVVIVDDLQGQAAGWWQSPVPGGERRYWAYSIIAAVAGQLGALLLQNTSGKNVVMRIEGVSAVMTSPNTYRWGYATTFPGTPADVFGSRDSRVQGGVAPFLVQETTSAGGLITSIFQETIGGAPLGIIPVDVVLNPGEQFGIECETANLQLNAGIYFTVRNLNS